MIVVDHVTRAYAQNMIMPGSITLDPDGNVDEMAYDRLRARISRSRRAPPRRRGPRARSRLRRSCAARRRRPPRRGRRARPLERRRSPEKRPGRRRPEPFGQQRTRSAARVIAWRTSSRVSACVYDLTSSTGITCSFCPRRRPSTRSSGGHRLREDFAAAPARPPRPQG